MHAGSPDEIVTLSIDATLGREAASAQCLTECCAQTTNDVHGLYYLDDPCRRSDASKTK